VAAGVGQRLSPILPLFTAVETPPDQLQVELVRLIVDRRIRQFRNPSLLGRTGIGARRLFYALRKALGQRRFPPCIEALISGNHLALHAVLGCDPLPE
jgi:hypothetical protein